MVLYYEKQFLKTPALRIAAWGGTALLLFVITMLFIEKQYAIAIVILFIIPAWLFLFLKINIETEIAEESIKVKMNPITALTTVIKFSSIENVSVGRYTSFFQFGGLGYKSIKNGVAYISGAPFYFEIRLKSGRAVTLSTCKKDEAIEVFRKLGIKVENVN